MITQVFTCVYSPTTPPFGHPSFQKEGSRITSLCFDIPFRIPSYYHIPSATLSISVGGCYLLSYFFNNPFEVFKHHTILKPKYRNACHPKQIICSLLIILFTHCVRLTIQFYCQLQRRTIKIKDIRSYTMLPPELQSIDLPFFQHPPQSCFGWCQCIAKLPSLMQPLRFVHTVFHLYNFSVANPSVKQRRLSAVAAIQTAS